MRALDLAQDHLSLYQLTIEEGTPFAARYAAGTLTIPEPERARRILCADTGAVRRRRASRL